MKIGWYTHHIEREPKVSEIGAQGDLGLFTGRFAGGAEMSDYEYRKAVPNGVEIVISDGNNYIEPSEFDSVVVTGTESFADWQLNQLAEYDPFVFVHHLQTPRESLKTLIDNARMFVTHTPAHMLREVAWTNPKRTGQVLSYFDTSEISHTETKYPNAVWAARRHPLKGLNQAQMWAAQNDIPLLVYTDVTRQTVLNAMATAEWFVHLPIAFESECRAVMEAVLAGCKVHANKNVGITSVEDWHDREALKNMIDKAGETFWRLVQM